MWDQIRTSLDSLSTRLAWLSSRMDILMAMAFFGAFVVVSVVGLSLVNARRRVRNINDVATQYRMARVSRFRQGLAGMLPQPDREREALEQDLKRAGFYGQNAQVEFLAGRNTLVVVVLLAGLGIAVALPPGSQVPQQLLIVTLLASALAYVGPRLILHLQASRRLDGIQRGLPDALDIIRMCLTGGLPLRDSLVRVSREVEYFHPDVAIELEVVRRHAELDSMTKALKEFARRMNAPDVNALASLVSQSERTGTNVAGAVAEFSDSIRRQFRQRAEERAGRTSIRMLFPVVLCLAPPVFILLIGPPVLQLKTFLNEARRPGGVLETGGYSDSMVERLTNSTDNNQRPAAPAP